MKRYNSKMVSVPGESRGCVMTSRGGMVLRVEGMLSEENRVGKGRMDTE